MQLDQLQLVHQLPAGVPIPRLRARLLALVEQASNQQELTQACLQVTQADYLGLVRKRHQHVRKGAICQK